MKALQTARICVIDDEEKEFTPLILALARIGLGCRHLTGTRVEELPVTPLKGLRLVFLDMNLETIGAEHEVAAHTANVFGKVVASDDGPLLVVLWTKRADLIAEFKNRLYGEFPNFRGRLVFARMDKPIGEIDGQKLEEDVRAELSRHAPLDLIWEWEKAVHDAASGTIGAIARLAAVRAGVANLDSEVDTAQKIRHAFSDLFRTLLDASAGQHATPETAIRHLFDGLHPLHMDRLDHASPLDANGSAEVLMWGPHRPLTSEDTGALNSMLLLAGPSANAADMHPGGLYRFQDGQSFENHCSCPWAEFAATMFDPNQLAQGMANAIPIAVELSASCDFAQRKRPVAKLLAGLLVPFSIQGRIKKADYLRHLHTVKLDNPAGLWLPVFNSRYLLSVSPPTLHANLTPIGRLRESLLIDLRNWYFAQAARVGYMYV